MGHYIFFQCSAIHQAIINYSVYDVAIRKEINGTARVWRELVLLAVQLSTVRIQHKMIM